MMQSNHLHCLLCLILRMNDIIICTTLIILLSCLYRILTRHSWTMLMKRIGYDRSRTQTQFLNLAIAQRINQMHHCTDLLRKCNTNASKCIVCKFSKLFTNNCSTFYSSSAVESKGILFGSYPSCDVSFIRGMNPLI